MNIHKKNCNGCRELLDASKFYKDKHKPDGLTTTCKDCRNKAPSRTKGNLVYFKNQSWSDINRRTVNGKYANPSHYKNEVYFRKGIKVEMTRDEFCNFCDDNASDIISLYAQGLTPSIDRIDESGHYATDNIRVISLAENVRRAHSKENG